MFSLANYTALVTGASGGIGQAIAIALHAQGAHVILSGTREQALNDLQKKLGERASILTCNFKDQNSLDNLFAKAEEITGKVDILVNNAGITKDNLLMRMKDEEWDDVIAVNLTSAFRICRSAVKSMMKRRWGRIINISSVVGVTGNPGQTNYCASKAGLIGFSKSLAQEVATRGITVNSIAPGFITSDMTQKLPAAVQEKILATIPMNRMGTADEIASAVVFLASQESSYITGQTLNINGGMAMI